MTAVECLILAFFNVLIIINIGLKVRDVPLSLF